jgi:hypothetical protein
MQIQTNRLSIHQLRDLSAIGAHILGVLLDVRPSGF